MGSESSDQMMALLQELCLLKKQRAESLANPDQSNPEHQIALQQREDDISQEIKTLGDQTSIADGPHDDIGLRK